jgi:hypothetical protein
VEIYISSFHKQLLVDMSWHASRTDAAEFTRSHMGMNGSWGQIEHWCESVLAGYCFFNNCQLSISFF